MKTFKTHMLASVMDTQEAIYALEAGADIIDLKNPHEGALGALPLNIITDVVKVIDRRALVSATVGDLPMQVDILLQAIDRTLTTQVDFIKIGFFGNQNHQACISAIGLQQVTSAKLIAVLFADELPADEMPSIVGLMTSLANAGFYGVMLDTAQKDGKHLLDHWDYEDLKKFCANAKKLNLVVGLAGTLGIGQINILLRIKPDYLGFRSALCEQGLRKNTLSKFKIIEVVAVLHKCNNERLAII